MFKLIGALIKTALFALIILLLGNLVRWDGRTISDHVRAQTAKLERSNSFKGARGWAEKISEDAKEGLKKVPNPLADKLQPASPSTASDMERQETKHADRREKLKNPPQERIPASERQKLRALIEELNTSSSAPARH